MKDKKQTPNDQRSVVKNPNNPQFDKSHGNRGNQLNPNNPRQNEKPKK
jgi:hypothetical protein